MKKKALLILAAMMAASMVACGSTNETTGSSAPAAANTEAEKVEESAPAETEKAEEPEESAQEELAFESFTPIDNEECMVTVKELDPDNMWGYTVKLGLENKSADKTYMFAAESVYVNGVDGDPVFASEVASGKKSNEDMTITSSALEENGITEITDIEVTFRVYDSNDWTADPVAKEVFHIYPLGEEKATTFTREAQATDVVLAENDKISVILIGQENDPIWGYTLKLFIQNKSDVEAMVSVDEASVNGYMADPFFAKTVLPGKCAFTSMSWANETLEENDITDVESIEFQLRAYDANKWDGNDLFNDTVTVTP